MPRYDVAVIGGGHNGLVAAAYLARAGRRVIILEGREEIGGCAVTHEIAPGFHVPALAHSMSIDAQVASDLGLAAQGLHLVHPSVSVFAPTPDKRSFVVWRDHAATAHELASWSSADAAKWPEFAAAARTAADVIGGLIRQLPPSVDWPSPSELVDLLRTGRTLRKMGRQGLYRFLRWGPMPIGDLVAEWIETPIARAVVCARGTLGTTAGPRSAGTAATWLLQAALEGHPAGAPTFAIGGPGSLAAALAVKARSAGADIQLNARVAAIAVSDDGASGVVLESGETIEARAVVSSADPKHTLLGLVDPGRLLPSFREKIQRFRARGTLAKVNLALGALPSFHGTAGRSVPADTLLSGRIHIGPTPEYLERAFDHSKYGEWSAAPWLEATIPSLTDSTLAPAGQHVMSIYAQWMPYALRGRDWDRERDALGDLVVSTLEEYAPGLSRSIVAREVLTPLDLERKYGLTGGHIFHGEHALDQLYAMRPVLGWAQHATPVRGLYLCGAGTHPGGGLTGRPGANAAKVVLRNLSRLVRAR
jgi:phytoene dehydrogenase-like protein